jgi:hypothetical protein
MPTTATATVSSRTLRVAVSGEIGKSRRHRDGRHVARDDGEPRVPRAPEEDGHDEGDDERRDAALDCGMLEECVHEVVNS